MQPMTAVALKQVLNTVVHTTVQNTVETVEVVKPVVATCPGPDLTKNVQGISKRARKGCKVYRRVGCGEKGLKLGCKMVRRKGFVRF